VTALVNVLKGFKNIDEEKPYSLTAKYLYDPGLQHKMMQYQSGHNTKQRRGEENERKWVHQYDTAMCSNVATVRGQWEAS